MSGASSSYSAAAPTPAQHGDPYRAAAPPVAAPLPATDPAGQQTPTQQPAPTAYFGAAPAAASSPAAARPPKRADRIVTILLLALGAYGALSLGLAMVQLPAQLRLAATVLKIDGFALPQPVATIGTIGAVLMLTIYAVALIFSIQRLRGRRLAFWVPLAAGALAFIVFFALAMIAYAQSAELLQAMSQPDALGSILDYSATAGR